MEGLEPSRRADAVRAGLVLAAVIAVFAAVFFGGASGDARTAWVGGAAVVLAGGLLVLAALGGVPVPLLDRVSLATVVAVCSLAAWAGVSIAWSVAGDESWSAFNKGIAYVGFLVLGLSLASLGTSTTRAIAGLLAAVLGLALAWALAGKAIPALAGNDASRVPRLHDPVGYANALALLADAALALGLWLAVGRRQGARRHAGAALVYVAVLAGLLTASRAGAVGAAAVLVLWLLLGPARVESALTAVGAGLPAGAVAGWAFTRPALVDAGRSHAERVSDGALFAALAVAGALAAVLALAFATTRLLPERERSLGRALVVLAAVGVVTGIAAVAIAVGNPVTRAAHGFSRGECVNTPGRFGTLCANNRLQWWREAGRIFAAHPAGGTGAGTFDVARTRYRTSGDFVREPHSVPLQVLAGTGVLGGLLLVVAAVAGAVALRRSVARADGAERAAAVALAGLPVAYAVHALVDYDLDFVAVSGRALGAVGALLAAGRPLARRRAGRLPALALAAVAATALAVLVLPRLAADRTDAAFAAADDGRVQQAADRARSARSLDPLSPQPLYALASAYETAVQADRSAGRDATGDLQAARSAYADATRLQPENADTWYQLGLFEFVWSGDMCAAYTALNHSYTLDPRNVHWTPNGELDRARDAVNDPQHPACGR